MNQVLDQDPVGSVALLPNPDPCLESIDPDPHKRMDPACLISNLDEGGALTQLGPQVVHQL